MEVTIEHENEVWKAKLYFHKAAISCFIYERAPWSSQGYKELKNTVVRFISYNGDFIKALAEVLVEVEQQTGLKLGTIDRSEDEKKRIEAIKNGSDDGADKKAVRTSVA